MKTFLQTLPQREPAVLAGAVATAIIAIVNVFLPEPLGQAAVDQINTVALILGPPILSLVIRREVFAPATVDELVAEAAEDARASQAGA